MILAAGLTPAWQQILVFDQFKDGEVNRASQAVWCASGKVLNVGCALHHFGAPSHTLSFAGGLPGQALRDDFTRLKVPATWIETSTPSRVCTTILDRQRNITTELVENAAAVTAEELSAYRRAFIDLAKESERIVLSGSLPAGTPAGYYRSLIESVIESVSCPVLLDFRGDDLRECLSLKPWLVKPNRAELAATVGEPLVTEADLLAAMQQLRTAGAEFVVVSDGPHAVWVAGSKGVSRFHPPVIEAVNPIGCGDCLAAGLAIAWHQGRRWDDAIEWAIGLAAENARHLLPARFSPSSS
ncbi:MAG TPA: PfkB family carbohydrate kinase [Planctomycetaceae bacterium]|nr:PfkB family carbohydrate kinase [Planctomycetaceae bacterium]